MRPPSGGQAIRLGFQALSILISALIIYELGVAQRTLPQAVLIPASWAELSDLDGKVVYTQTTLPGTEPVIDAPGRVLFTLAGGLDGHLDLSALEVSPLMEVTGGNGVLVLSGALLLRVSDQAEGRSLTLSAAPEDDGTAARLACTRALSGQQGIAYLMRYVSACMLGRFG
jgi:hypothetical protein